MVFGRKSGDKAAKKPKAKVEKKPKAKAKPARKAAGVAVKKRPSDIYTVMLMMSLGFTAVAILFLALELAEYGFPSTFTPWK